MSKEIKPAKVPDNAPATVGNNQISAEVLIAQAIEKGVPVETMEKLFGLRERIRAEQAREAYVIAVANFQKDCPVIKKSKQVKNKDGTLRYTFAPLDSIVEQIKKPLAANELSYRWETKQEADSVRAICIVTHSHGHSETSDFAVPVTTDGFMTAPQKVASALTFAKRYSLCNALGISTGDEDVDATDVKKEVSPKSDKAKIVFVLKTLGFDTATKEAVEKAVKDQTGYVLEEKNYGAIVGRLETILREKQEYDHESREIR